jgi:hypothetical protein
LGPGSLNVHTSIMRKCTGWGAKACTMGMVSLGGGIGRIRCFSSYQILSFDLSDMFILLPFLAGNGCSPTGY